MWVMVKVAAFGGLMFALFAGCATTGPVLSMTYLSDPAGASLYEGARLLGYTPVTLTYQDSRTAFAHKECLRLNSLHVRWASGVVASAPNLQACPGPGYSQQYLFKRPADVPGLEADVDYAARLDRDPALQEQASVKDATIVAANIQSLKTH
jgi:hypothetical protein